MLFPSLPLTLVVNGKLLTENHFAKKTLAERGSTTPPPLTENHCAQKSLAERGGTPPLNGKNPLSSF